MCASFCVNHKFLFLWEKCPGMQLPGCVVVVFHFLKKLSKCLQSSCAILHFHRQHVKDLLSPRPHWHLVRLQPFTNFACSFYFSYSDRHVLRFHWGLNHFLMANHVKQLFTCLFAICMSSSRTCHLPIF